VAHLDLVKQEAAAMQQSRHQTSVADIVEVARAAASGVGDALVERRTQARLLGRLARLILYLAVFNLALQFVQGLDGGQLAQRWPHLALYLAGLATAVVPMLVTHLLAGVVALWEPMARGYFFHPRRLARRGRRLAVGAAFGLALSTSQYAMWLVPVADQEGPLVRGAATIAATCLVGARLGRCIVRPRAARIGSRIHEEAAELRAGRAQERERSGASSSLGSA
jgi:hypothetical protein